MLYAIISEDVNNSLQNRLKARPDHLARLEQLQNEGRLIIAGPHPSIDSNEPGEAGFSGSLIVAEFASLDDAQNWADADPYITAGVYQQVTVKPFKKVFPAS
ncbi:MAG: YciI family protein [Gammaproteobacteria bacterium]|nr:YciI family protein [Gammaproteobacteria bacterium]